MYDSGRTAPDGTPIKYRDAGYLEIRNNSFYNDDGEGEIQVAIGIDAGNDRHFPKIYDDGVLQNPVPGFQATQDAEGRREFDHLVTFYSGKGHPSGERSSGAYIRGNYGRESGQPIEADQFGIALSKVANVEVVDNDIKMVGGGSSYAAGINVENLAHDIDINRNDIELARHGEGSRTVGIALSPLKDHGFRGDNRTSTQDVSIKGTKFSGEGRAAIAATAPRDLELGENLDFSDFKPVSRNGEEPAHIALTSTDTNGDGVTNDSERPTFSPALPWRYTEAGREKSGVIVQEGYLLKGKQLEDVTPPRFS